MNWIKNFVRPKFESVFRGKDDTEENLWVNCTECGEMIFHRDMDDLGKVCPGCDHHMRLSTKERFELLFDASYELVDSPEVPVDPLKFKDQKRYIDRLKEARNKTGMRDAVSIGVGDISGVETVVVVQDFAFMGGSLGMAAGEAVIRGGETALEKKCPFIVVAAAGGARMQEGIMSLMQMPRTTVIIQELRDRGLPYIVILTDPTTGGVTASYGMLGDVHIAEPGALIGFAGPRVIQDTINEKLPEGFQRAEYLLEHGMVDMVVHRHRLAETLGRLLRLLIDPQSGQEKQAIPAGE